MVTTRKKLVVDTNLRGRPYLPVGQQCGLINVLKSTMDVFRVAAFHNTHRAKKDGKLHVPRHTPTRRETRPREEGPTPIGAMMIWSTATLFESAAKLVGPSLLERRGNLNSRY